MTGRPVRRVPGCAILRGRGQPDQIRWPNGVVTEMRFWALADPEEDLVYRADPIWLPVKEARKLREP